MSVASVAAEKLYTLEELSDLGYGTVANLRKYVSQGNLQAHKIGRFYRVSQSDLDLFLETTRVVTPSLYSEFVDTVVALAPEFTPEQRRRIAEVISVGAVA
ncbi:helix-turn-helix domain-containing protein [Corynebacterium sp. 153RC1]|uniref:helix-turn-helix domain-containing protein n=1 Tax=unclassified Corynebacterium TaxID=2624378 RepID=UPI00211C2B1F|nr:MULTISPECIES: helix-turn-helix domain-containing protein [unclassified Corynebacterium]MCQ9352231.1 helix-turn-helix domain-containing protein [Corynebacterium sp. 209RC1]MCQ9355732.1 helix-turn-helix domain-containing protein [Corynebacterium sp. 1222RC1]MCQ9356514.1 helix-turn-helix domain-containing protein [Corynebacterium sp. 122RC1]MCQ9358616.1 helix-turn-helix domain-containing protein [Corynebacterium sp. 142RC1]MCQ9362241.1 helix-turn-helix domain-containing protein [Corynebacteriu